MSNNLQLGIHHQLLFCRKCKRRTLHEFDDHEYYLENYICFACDLTRFYSHGNLTYEYDRQGPSHYYEDHQNWREIEDDPYDHGVIYFEKPGVDD